MKLGEIYKLLDKISPFELQEPWDNSGLIVGNFESEIKKIVLSVDIDDELVDSLESDTLLITHHPLIFKGLKELNFSKYPSNLLQKMIQNNISNIAMHTNFDKTHLGEYVAKDILGYENFNKDGFVVYFDVHEEFDTFVAKISKKLLLKEIKCVKSAAFVKKAALVTGSGASLLSSIDAECFLTGDIKYHDAMEAKSLNLSMVDIGHFESEHFFAEILLNHLKNLGLEAIISSSKNPFTYI